VLLTCRYSTGPLYVVVGVIQMLLRAGFDMRSWAISLLSNEDLDWTQIINFSVCVMQVIAGAAGVQRALRSSRVS